MQRLIKSIHSFKWMMPVLTTTILFCACGSAETKKDGTNADSMSVKQAPADSIKPPPKMDSMSTSPRSDGRSTTPGNNNVPPLDTSANGRPDGVPTGPPSQN